MTNLGVRVVRAFETVADRRWMAAGVAGLVVLFYCIVVAGIRMPVPRVQDEFSYLLAADTYAAGRLTNPPHRLGDHFDSADILREPTYQSKYPPGQGLFLAVGQKVGGHPLFGVWLSLALACAALVWMLQAWVGGRWALFGGLLAASNGPMVFEWGGGYMGGAVAMLGGALLFGGLRRTVDEPRPANSVPLALGVAILANTRPYEGLVASLLAAVFLVAWLIRETRVPRRLLTVRVLMPVAAMLVLTAVLMGYYNWAVTGTPWRLPYQVHMEYYGGPDNFGSLSEGDAGSRQLATLVADILKKIGRLFLFWGGNLGVPVVLSHVQQTVDVLSVFILGMLPWIARNRWTLFALLTFGLTLGAASLTANANHHYIAPVVPLYFVLAVESIRTVWRSLSGRMVVRRLVATTFLVVWVLTQRSEVLIYMNQPEAINPAHWTNVRQLLAQPLERDEFSHLVVVRPEPGVEGTETWVYNRANIDRAKVVWAWEVEAIPNRRLLSYYAGRHAWLLDLTGTPLELVELSGPQLDWSLREQGGAVGRLEGAEDDPGAVRVSIDQAGTEPWHLQLESLQPPVRGGARYTVVFRARADAPRAVGVHVSQAHDPWSILGLHRTLELTTEWQQFAFDFSATQGDVLVRLGFDLGGSSAGVDIADQALTPAVQR